MQEDKGPVHILPTVKVPFINTFNIERNRSNFKYNKIYIDISNKILKTEVDIYSKNINGKSTNASQNPPLLYVTSSPVTIIDDDFDLLFNTELFNNYLYNIYRFTNPSKSTIPIYKGITNVTSDHYPYVSEKSVNNVEIKNVIIDLDSETYHPKSSTDIGHSPIQIKFDAILAQYTPEIPNTINGGPIPSKRDVTTTVTNVAPLISTLSAPNNGVIFDLDNFYVKASDYALRKYNRSFYTVIGQNPFDMRDNIELNNYKYIVFPSNGSYTFQADIPLLHYIIVGAGGAGGRAGKNIISSKRTIQGGGAGGNVITGTLENIEKESLLNVVIGAGGIQGEDLSKYRDGGSGGSTSFVITKMDSTVHSSSNAPGGAGGGGGESGRGKGGKYGSEQPGMGGSKVVNRVGTYIQIPTASDAVVFNDGCITTWTFAAGGGAGGYDLEGQIRLGASIGYQIGGGNKITVCRGGDGQINNNLPPSPTDLDNTQNGRDITGLKNGKFTKISSGSGGGGGGYGGGSGSNGFAMFYWLYQ